MSKRVTGFDRLDRKLAQFSSGLGDDVVRKALRSGAQLIADEAKRLAPVDTGLLRDSIAVSDERDHRLYARQGENGTLSVFVGPIGSTDDGPVRYARFVEFGTRRHEGQPFMRPAIAAKRDDAGRLTAELLRMEIRRVAK